ncbi:MAG: hypothetical protein IJU90_04760 [Bacteroidales bacterium]|nr:hypothetical protein [Bacteroidales bacterium]
MANKVAQIVQEEYGWRYDKCFCIVLMSKWFRDNRLTVDEISQTNPKEVYSIVKQQIEFHELV